jgi:hypothetical protein
MRSNCSDGAKVGANFGSSAGEKVTIALFLGTLIAGEVGESIWLSIYKFFVVWCLIYLKSVIVAFQTDSFSELV